MNCLEWETKVSLHAGGDLAGAEAEDVERHLGECSACQLLWSGVRESLVLLRTAHAGLPEAAYFTAVRSRVMAELERGAHPWRRLAWISGVAALAAVLLLAVWPSRVAPEAPRMLARIPPAPEVAKVRRNVAAPVSAGSGPCAPETGAPHPSSSRRPTRILSFTGLQINSRRRR